MTRDEVRTLVESDLGKCTSDAAGIAWGPMRLDSVGDGHDGEWWIRFPGHEESSLASPVGALRTKRELRRALRTTVQRIVKWGLAMSDSMQLESEPAQ